MPACLDHHVDVAIGRALPRRENGVYTELQSRLPADRAGLDDVDRFRTASTHKCGCKQTDRSGTVDEDALALNGFDPVERMQDAGEGLDQRARGPVDFIRQRKDDADRNGDFLGHGTIRRDADGHEVATQIGRAAEDLTSVMYAHSTHLTRLVAHPARTHRGDA
jgi:hypothetical protein